MPFCGGGLRMLINARPDILWSQKRRSGIEAVQAIHNFNPDVAILDVTMPRIRRVGCY